MEIKLSIAIPTYNGAQTIRETLDSIVSQLEDGVEIVVSDNASTDGTAEIVQEYSSSYPIKYFRNDRNIGPCRNYELAVERSSGRFIWYFSDDDVIREKALSKVLTIISENEHCGCIVLDCQVYDFTKKCVLLDGLNQAKKSFYVDETENIFKTPVIDIIGVASTVIFKRELIKNVDKSSLYNTRHLHIGIVSYISTISKVFVSDEKIFLFRRCDEGARWMKDSFNLNFHFGYLYGIHFGIKHKTEIKSFVNRRIITLILFVIQMKLENIAIEKSMFSHLFRNRLKLWTYPYFWLTLPALMFVYLTPSLVWKLLKMLLTTKKKYLKMRFNEKRGSGKVDAG